MKVGNLDIKTLKGEWFKVLGLDERYDCFECQQNRYQRFRSFRQCCEV